MPDVCLAFQPDAHAVTITPENSLYAASLDRFLSARPLWQLLAFHVDKLFRSGQLGQTPHSHSVYLSVSREPARATFQDRCSGKLRKQGIISKAFISSLSTVTWAILSLGPWSSPACCSFSIKGVMYIVGRYIASPIVCRSIARLEHSALNGKGILFGQSSETRAWAARQGPRSCAGASPL